MRKYNKIIISLVIIALILSTFAFANSSKKTIEVLFNSVKLTVNGQKVEADTIAYQGVTYVPLRATAEMLGKEVGWDQATMTASINDKAAVKEPEPAKPVTNDKETLAQKNAIKSAESYLGFSAFSKSGLIKQLEYEGFSNADASYAVGSLKVDWKEQAFKSAESYLEFSSFSRKGLIEQLQHEGFTKEEAEYGVGKTGL